MNEIDVIESPQLTTMNPPLDDGWRREYAAFVRLLPDLLKSHHGKFVAIHDGKIVAVADTFKDAAMQAYQCVGYVPLHVGQVVEHPVGQVRLPSPRLTRPAVSK
ncbi:MAG TPA: DUF5678 domain-containing protein [Tepidisphaeraceae bacterium]|nr:DUF5678 domain-containing protein [Tepidisphaeraceae bacterium]